MTQSKCDSVYEKEIHKQSEGEIVKKAKALAKIVAQTKLQKTELENKILPETDTE